MNSEEILKMTAAIFVMRAKYWNNKAKANYDEAAMGASIAYDNAFDMLAYAAKCDWDGLRQFDWSDEAEELLEKVGFDIDFYELEELIRKGE